MLDHNDLEYFTYRLPEEKTLRVVLRGVPQNILISDIESDLKERGFVPIRINRMTKKSANGKIDMPLVLVELKRMSIIKAFITSLAFFS